MRDRDHTREGILGSVLVLALPSVLMSLLGAGVFQMAELRFLGDLGPDAMAAAGATNQILRQVMFLLAFGVQIATQMWIAQAVGRGSLDAAEHAAGQSFWLGAALSGMALVGALFAEPLVGWVTTDADVAALGVPYIRITLVTFFLFVVAQLFGAILLGAGDSTTPLLVNLVTTPVGILGQFALAFGAFGLPALGISGIAWGAALGGLSGLFLSGWALVSGRCRVHLRARHFRLDPEVLQGLLRISWQPALHFVARSLIIMVFMWLAGRLGGEVQAAYMIGLRVEILAVMVAFPLANACATMVGQNLGAGDVGRAWRSIFVSSAVILAMLGPAALGMNLFRHEIVGFFADDPDVVRMAAGYLFWSSLVLPLYGIYFVAFRTLQASGDMNTPMIISIGTALGVGVPLGVFLVGQEGFGATGMWIANAAYAAINAVLMTGWMARGRWARRVSGVAG